MLAEWIFNGLNLITWWNFIDVSRPFEGLVARNIDSIVSTNAMKYNWLVANSRNVWVVAVLLPGNDSCTAKSRGPRPQTWPWDKLLNLVLQMTRRIYGMSASEASTLNSLHT